ncbi:MAG TPA: DinB family protein [Gemmatimonadales bacterium]|nr:DinB family protein [Gemmatimonadales bacterium]
MSEKQKFQEAWDNESATTLKLLKAYPQDKPDLKPHPSCRTAKELAWTFVFEGVAGSQAVQGEMKFPPPNMPPMPSTWQGMITEVEKALKVIGDKVKKVDDAQLNTTVKFMTGPKKMSDMRRMDVLWFLLNDQIHHRGQFSVYLRMSGAKVPSIYGPSGDEKWN